MLAAQDSIGKARLYHLKEAVVTSYKSRFNIVSPIPMQSLSGEALERINALSVADAIRFFSGVQLKDYGGVGGLKTINVRSIGTNHTAVFYDGVQLGNVQNGQVDLGKFSLDNMEEIQLYNGQKSSIFQPARGFFAASSLFLKSKQPLFDQGRNYQLRTNLRGGSFGLVNPSILWHRKLSASLTLATNVEWNKAHGRYKYRYTNGSYDTIAVRQNGDIESYRFETALFGKLKKGTWNLRAYYFDSERGLPGAIVAGRYSHYQRQWDENLFLQAFYQQAIGTRYELMMNLKYSNDHTRYIDPEYRTTEGALDNRYHQNEYYASIVQQFHLTKWWNISLSTDFSVNTLEANIYRFPYPTRYSSWAVASSHVSFKRLDLQGSLLACVVTEEVKYYQQGDRVNKLSPVLSASWQPFSRPTFRLRAFYKESFRMPTFNDLYYTFVGNSSLRPEYATQYNVGATWSIRPRGRLDELSIQSDAYYNHVRNKIVAMPSANLFRWTMMNLGEVDITGLECNTTLAIRLPTTLRWGLGLNYTYQKAIDVTNGGTTYGDQIPYIPLHSGTVTASLTWFNWQINYSFIYTGERYDQKANIPMNYMEPWYTSDLALSWRGKWRSKELRLMTEINNAFNQYYDVIRNFPMPGRSYRFNLSIILN